MAKAFTVAGEIRLKDGVTATARQAERSMTRTARQSGRATGKLNRELATTNTRLQTQAARWGKIQTATGKVYQGFMRKAGYGVAALGGATILAGKQIANFDDRLRSLGISAGKNGMQLEAFTRKFKQVVRNTAIANRTSSDEIMSGLEAIVEKTGDLDFATNNIDMLAKSIRGARVAGQDAGAIMSEFQKRGFNKAQVNEALNVLTAQGQKGAFTLQNLAAMGERVFAAYNPQNIRQVREMGATLQFIRQATGSSDQATTGLEAFSRMLSDAKKVKGLTKAGIKVFDPTALKKGVKELRPYPEILAGVLEQTKGDALKISALGFDAESLRTTKAFQSLYKQGKDPRVEAQKLVAINAKGIIEADAKDMAKGMGAATTALKEAYGKFADDSLSEPVQRLADTLNNLQPQEIQRFFHYTKKAAISLVAIYALGKGLSTINTVVKSVNSLRNPLGVQRVRITNPPLKSTVQRVFVVNQPGGGGRNQRGRNAPVPLTASQGATPKTKGRLPRVKNLAKGIGKGGLAGTALYLGGQTLTSVAGEDSNLAKYGSSAMEGAAYGAMVGSIIPGLGTAIGAGIGAAGGLAAQAISDWFGSNKPNPAQTQEQLDLQRRQLTATEKLQHILRDQGQRPIQVQTSPAMLVHDMGNLNYGTP